MFTYSPNKTADRSPNRLLLSIPGPVSGPAAPSEAPAERCDPRLPGGLQGVQPRRQPPVHHHQCGHHRRHHGEHHAGQPEEIHPVQCGGAGRQPSRNRAVVAAGGHQNSGRR